MVYTIHTRPDGTKYKTLDVSNNDKLRAQAYAWAQKHTTDPNGHVSDRFWSSVWHSFQKKQVTQAELNTLIEKA